MTFCKSLPKTLVTEDEAEIMTIYRIILESGGYKALATVDGEACLDAYKNELGETPVGQLPVDLLVLDQRMPKMGGAKVAKEILALTPNQPIRIITAYRDHAELKTLRWQISR